MFVIPSIRSNPENHTNHWNCWFTLTGWLLSTVLGLALVFGLYHSQLSDTTEQAYLVLARSAWSIVIAWIILACALGHGGVVNDILSWPGFLPGSKLSYCAYLIHPLVSQDYQTFLPQF